MSYELMPYRFPFDETGQSVKNLITAEPKSLPTVNHIPFPVNEGLFYVDSVIVKNALGNVLVKGTDYTFRGADSWISAKTGKEVAAAIDITDKTFTGDLTITYQCVGGAEGRPYGLVRDLLDAIQSVSTNITINWPDDINNIPAYFTPAPHGHPLEALEQLDKLVHAHEQVFNALISRVPMHGSGQHLQEQIDRLTLVVRSCRNSINQISAVTGSIGQIQDILDTLDKIETIASNTATINSGQEVVIGQWDLNEINAVQGGIVCKAANDIESMSFNLQATTTTAPTHCTFGILRTASPMIELISQRLGTQMQLRARALINITIKTKIAMAL